MVHVFHQLRQKEGTAQFLRFCINGVIAASIHYGIYYLLQLWTDVNIAYTAGYLISFVYNFIATNYFTFHTHPTWKNFVGFAGSHGVNYFLHIVLFNLFLFRAGERGKKNPFPEPSSKREGRERIKSP